MAKITSRILRFGIILMSTVIISSAFGLSRVYADDYTYDGVDYDVSLDGRYSEVLTNIGNSCTLSVDEKKIKIKRSDGNKITSSERARVLDSLDLAWFYKDMRIHTEETYTCRIGCVNDCDFGEYSFRIMDGYDILDDQIFDLEEDDMYYVSMTKNGTYESKNKNDLVADKYNIIDDDYYDYLDDLETRSFLVPVGSVFKLDALKDMFFPIYRVGGNLITDLTTLDLKFEWYSGNDLLQTGRVFNCGKITKGFDKDFTVKVYAKSYEGSYEPINDLDFYIKAIKPSVKLNVSGTLPMKVNKTIKLNATCKRSDSIVSWKSSRPSVATVNNKGKITAKKTGTTIITVETKLGATATLKVKVQKKDIKTTGLKVKVPRLSERDQEVLSVNKVPITSTQKITYKSSNPKVATINSKGMITAKKRGKTTITVKSGSCTKTFTLNVTYGD